MSKQKINSAQQETVLYNNTSGSADTITLSETSANFSYLKIYYNDILLNGTHCQEIYSPDGKKTCLSSYVYGDGTAYTNLYEAHADITVSGTSITWGHNGYTFSSSGGVNTHYNTAKLNIIRVIGYK